MPSHPKQMTNSTSNKPTTSVMKVKSKNRRRNRKKKKQKLQYPIHEMRKMTNKSANLTYNAKDATQNQMAVAQMWAKTYETMIRLQFQHRIHYWKNLAMNRNAEIELLKRKLTDAKHDPLEMNDMESTDENETNAGSTDETDTNAGSTDETDTNAGSKSQYSSEESESYLKFLEITLRHRQQRKRNLEKEVDSN